MKSRKIHIGRTELNSEGKTVKGGSVEIDNERFYKISNYDFMPDFFITIVSDSDHWMYISSNGSLTAGRKNRDNAAFPYYTDDKIHDYKGKTGSKTLLLVKKKDTSYLWEPFTDESSNAYSIERNIYKSIYGNKVWFEETNLDLELNFRYGWCNSEKFGWIKKSNVLNLSNTDVQVEVLDGMLNILPYGIDYLFQNEYSNLVDAYKKNELLEKSNLGLFMLSSIPVDRAEPSEALKATTVWSAGAKGETGFLISDKQLNNFRQGNPITTETDVRAARGAYFLLQKTTLNTKEKHSWFFAIEINQDATAIANLNHLLVNEKNIKELVHSDIKAGTINLEKIVGSADGLQMGNEELAYARHYSNTLFNIMRGGIFTKSYQIDKKDFRLYVRQTNSNVDRMFDLELSELPNKMIYSELLNWAREIENSDLERIALEYLPLTFSRRHGDPSRPWNLFSIETKNSDGTDKLSYQGNWRDIFQNWEALSLSYPEYIDGMISKFLNASTADGYNPYRITREGIDWEAPNPDEPWAYIGYWGDHQIIYLQKFLEISDSYYPGKLDELLTRDIFVYANVPYRIKSFEQIKANPKDTISFDHQLNEKLLSLSKQIGSDGKLLQNSEGEIVKANLAEKILVTFLAKLSNFIPEAGIWLNTQRPEWNDANNALVGNGVSMVTLYYIRRFLSFWISKFEDTKIREVLISREIKVLLDTIFNLFAGNTDLLKKGFSDKDRYKFAVELGQAGSEYRKSIYQNSFSGDKEMLEVSTLNEFLKLTLQYIDQTIHKNRREDGLYHAYNLISISGKSISVRYLYEMLEGQVAVLSSGFLDAEESLEVLEALKASKLFRKDQYSYILYPNRNLPRFTEKNNIPEEKLQQSELLQKLLIDGDTTILTKDKTGVSHFIGAFRNADVLSRELDKLDKKIYGELLVAEKDFILDVYETIFDHQSFTGRSGTFFGYEGLGSIYWHMVSKLLLAVQENYFKAISENSKAGIPERIKAHYYEIKAGIGLYKSPDLYGAFPTDAYSHTPENAGVKQPGLTGQVKEDVISRFGELGVQVKNGIVSFNPILLSSNEILKETRDFKFYNLARFFEVIRLEAGQLGFTFCQVPVIYTFGDSDKLVLKFSANKTLEFKGNILPEKYSSSLFQRRGEIEQIKVFVEHKP